MKDEDNKHDPMDQNLDENDAVVEEIEKITGTGEVRDAEDSALNTDNDTAMEASEASIPELDPEVEEEFAEAEEAFEKKHKNRESTSEKAKKAAAERILKGESQTAAPVSAKKLDPLRLRGKKYRASFAQIEKDKQYSLEEAIELVKKTAYASFDGAVELHAKVSGDGVRGTITLPAGTGKSRKVAVADEETLEAIAAGKLDFDVLLATPAQMPKLAKFAKVLGPKGLMPSPKAGTVTDDIEKVKAEIGGGRVEYRADKTGVVHMSIGRVSFATEKLAENFKVVEQALFQAKIASVSLSSTMGPGVKVAVAK
jgi:large subunit ribosomal protein L1